MKFTLRSRKILNNIASASGIEAVGDSFYIMGDDSHWVYRLNGKLEIEDKIQISDSPLTSATRIPKPQKPDLEAMVALGQGKNTALLLLGSGSKSPKRDVLVKITFLPKHSVKKYSLTKFYDSLCETAGFIRTKLNIEAAAVIEESLYLFNRGKNRIFRLNMRDFLSHAEGKNTIPSVEVFKIKLPRVNGMKAGFSGATASPDSKHILFTASVENTSNSIDDGEILGSFVGMFSVNSLKNDLRPDCVSVTDQQNNILKIKVESLAVHRPISTNTLHLLLVTDDDQTSSELIEAELKW